MIAFTTSLTRGETFTLGLEAVEGSIEGLAISAALKPAEDGNVPADSVPVAQVFTATAVDEVVPSGGPGWMLTLSPAQTAALSVGAYVADARVLLPGGNVDMIGPVRINVFGRVTQ